MNIKPQDKRKSKRFDTNVEVFFHYPYDINTKVDYHVTNEKGGRKISPKYSGISKNVSAEGLCFHSSEQLNGGDNLLIELHLPGDRSTVIMEGTVRWSHQTAQEKGFDTGVKLLTVDGKLVHESVYFDPTYHVEWSAVLEAVLGKFRVLSQNRRKENQQ